MMTKIMECFSIVVLLLVFFCNLPVGPQAWSARNGGYIELFNMLVYLTALLFVAQAFRRGEDFWVVGFVAIAVLFNPLVPVTLSRKMFLGLDAACILTFLASLAFSKRRPILTIPSITNYNARSESL